MWSEKSARSQVCEVCEDPSMRSGFSSEKSARAQICEVVFPVKSLRGPKSWSVNTAVEQLVQQFKHIHRYVPGTPCGGKSSCKLQRSKCKTAWWISKFVSPVVENQIAKMQRTKCKNAWWISKFVLTILSASFDPVSLGVFTHAHTHTINKGLTRGYQAHHVAFSTALLFALIFWRLCNFYG